MLYGKAWNFQSPSKCPRLELFRFTSFIKLTKYSATNKMNLQEIWALSLWFVWTTTNNITSMKLASNRFVLNNIKVKPNVICIESKTDFLGNNYWTWKYESDKGVLRSKGALDRNAVLISCDDEQMAFVNCMFWLCLLLLMSLFALWLPLPCHVAHAAMLRICLVGPKLRRKIHDQKKIVLEEKVYS
mgnify:CR=1 FL=1